MATQSPTCHQNDLPHIPITIELGYCQLHPGQLKSQKALRSVLKTNANLYDEATRKSTIQND
jgi:hypothetical protein